MNKINEALIKAESARIAKSEILKKKVWEKGHAFYKKHPVLFNVATWIAVLVFVGMGVAYSMSMMSGTVLAASNAGGGGNASIGPILKKIGAGIQVIGYIILARGILDFAISMKDAQGGGGEFTSAMRYIGAGAAVAATGIFFSTYISEHIQSLGIQ